MQLRKTKYSDLKTLLGWANDRLVIKNSISRNSKVNIKEHSIWLKRNLISRKNNIYIASKKSKLIGMIRTNRFKKYYLISYSIDKKYRNKGYGLKIVDKITQKLFKINKKIYFKAIVKKENKNSQKIFKKLNFSILPIKNKNFFEFVKKYNI